mgnify:FL=1
MTRGDFLIRLADYFGWYHYNGVMDDGTDIDNEGNIMTEYEEKFSSLGNPICKLIASR